MVLQSKRYVITGTKDCGSSHLGRAKKKTSLKPNLSLKPTTLRSHRVPLARANLATMAPMLATTREVDLTSMRRVMVKIGMSLSARQRKVRNDGIATVSLPDTVYSGQKAS